MSKVLLITGASSGIGEATARKAAKEAAKALSDKTQKEDSSLEKVPSRKDKRDRRDLDEEEIQKKKP